MPTLRKKTTIATLHGLMLRKTLIFNLKTLGFKSTLYMIKTIYSFTQKIANSITHRDKQNLSPFQEAFWIHSVSFLAFNCYSSGIKTQKTRLIFQEWHTLTTSWQRQNLKNKQHKVSNFKTSHLITCNQNPGLRKYLNNIC